MEKVLNEILERIKTIEADVKAIKKRNDNKDSFESGLRDFAINIAANLAGSAIQKPILGNLNNYER